MTKDLWLRIPKLFSQKQDSQRLQSKAYLHDIIDHAVRKGVKFDKPAMGVTR